MYGYYSLFVEAFVNSFVAAFTEAVLSRRTLQGNISIQLFPIINIEKIEILVPPTGENWPFDLPQKIFQQRN